jgi:hypothetical protein
MIKRLRGFGLAVVGAGAFAASLAAQTNPPIPPAPIPNVPGSAAPSQAAPPDQAAAANPVCARLEGQLAILNRSASDPARAEQIKRNEDAVAKQQAELDRTLGQSRKQGCEGGGFFALFTGRSPACQPLNAQIQQMRDNLDHLMSDLEHLKSGNSDQEGPRRALIGQLAQNNCGPQYRAAAAAQGPGGFLDALFGGIINPGGEGAPSGTYRTVCVRTCDGYYFPISYSTSPTRFAEDQRACQRECPASEAVLYTYRNPGEDIGQALSIGGAPYTELPNAFRYRKEFNASCSCRRPGQTWADALKGADDATTLESGDIVVTDQNAKALSQPLPPKGSKPLKSGGKVPDANETPATPGAAAAPAAPQDISASAAAGDSDPSKRTVRSVGTPFVAGH